MGYRTGNYDFVVDSSFQPFSLQEMLVPFSAYKDAFEKTEDAYNTLSDNSDKFKYLSETLPEGSKARQLYEGYANDLRKSAEDLAHNGLNMGNRRALSSLKRRYSGEIGRLVTADTALQKELDLRREAALKDPTMLYASDNLNIDNFLDSNKPNLYGISSNDLYTMGAAAGKAASSRQYSAGDSGQNTLGGLYKVWIEKMGYTPEQLARFRNEINNDFRSQVSTLPELQQAADDILTRTGANANLTGTNLQRARQSVISGIIDGSIYQESDKPMRDENVLSRIQKIENQRAQDSLNLQAASQGMVKDKDGNWKWDWRVDPSFQKAATVQNIKNSAKGSKSSTSGGSGSTISINDKPIEIDFNEHTDYKDYTSTELGNNEKGSLPGGKIITSTSQLPKNAKETADAMIGANGDERFYTMYWNEKNGKFRLVPKKSINIKDAGDIDVNDDIH